MGFAGSMVIMILGGIIGFISGGVGTGYFVIHKSLVWIASGVTPGDLIKITEGIMVLLFSKVIIFVGAVAGGGIGSIPGLYYLLKDDEF